MIQLTVTLWKMTAKQNGNVLHTPASPPRVPVLILFTFESRRVNGSSAPRRESRTTRALEPQPALDWEYCWEWQHVLGAD